MQVRSKAEAPGPAQGDADMQEAEPSGAEPQPLAQAAPGGGLTDAQLMQVFKQTSIFNVRSALAGNESLVYGGEAEADADRCWEMSRI